MQQQNIVLGAGKLYLALDSAAGVLGGERYLGDTPGFEISVQSQSQEYWGSDTAIAEKLEDVVTRVTRASTIQCNDISDENLALFVMGSINTITQSAGAVTEEAHTVIPDYYYQLGTSAHSPTGVRDVTAVVVTDSTGATTHEAGTDYEIDLELARLHILPGGAIAAAGEEEVLVDYSTSAGSRTQVITDALVPQIGALRYVADNTRGEKPRPVGA